MKKLHILDWSWYFYRAYHALPELNDKDWHNVNSIYGFFRMLIKFLQEKPDYFVIALDSPVRTIRHDLFEDYKANRPKMPDNFKWQVRTVKDIIRDLEIPHLEVPTYEADDIIYTLVNNFKHQDYHIYIDSLDKDLKQLISHNVTCVNPMKYEHTDTDKFILDYWFEPKYMLDYLCLLWDSSDNVPWVKWVWEKTAKDLIAKYWTIENIYNNIEQLSGAMKQRLIDWKESAFGCIDLIKLYEVPWLNNTDIEVYKPNIDLDKWEHILTKQYWFWSIKKMLDWLRNTYKTWSQFSLFW